MPPAYPKGSTLSQRRAYKALHAFCLDPASAEASSVLCGYAGTGKTWLAVHLIQAVCAQGLRVAVCAPTHKAIAVISAKLTPSARQRVWYGTLHALLGLKLRETHEGGMDATLDRNPKTLYFESYDVVFIDESSMVGPDLLAYIERFQRGARTRVVYIGDPGQLAPVVQRARPEGSAQGQLALAEEPASVPPVFARSAPRYDLQEIVRQKSTGRPHPIVQFAQEIRRYIEHEADGVFDPAAISAYLAAHAADMVVVRKAQARDVAAGAISLRKRRPAKDIRVLAWRNRVVDTHNRLIHEGLASLYGHAATATSARAPFWPGETIIARETLYGFRAQAAMAQQDAKTWEEALAPLETAQQRKDPERTRRDALVALIANNTEMVVRSCEPWRHPYLDIDSYRIEAQEAADAEAITLFVAADPRAYDRLVRKTWDGYRSSASRRPEDFRRAWAVTRACAPVMHGYAMTAHKAQGSTFDYALIDVADLAYMIAAAGADDYHRALYVAVTRAAEQVWLCL